MKKLYLIISNAIYMFKTMWSFNKTLFAGRLTTSILNGIMLPLDAYILKVLIDKISEFNWLSAVNIIIVMISIKLTNWLLHSWINKKLGASDNLFRNYLVFEINAKVSNMDYELLYNPEMMQKKDMALKAAQENRAIKYVDVSFSYISYLITFASILYLLSSFSWWIYMIVLLLSLIKIYTAMARKKQVFNHAIEVAPINTELSYYTNVLIDETYVNDVRMYSISDWIVNKYKQSIERGQNIFEKLLVNIFRYNVVKDVMTAAEEGFIYFFVATQTIFNGMSFANFTLATSALRTFSSTITKAITGLLDIAENSAYIQIYREFMNTENRIAVPGKGKPIETITNHSVAYVFSDVNFAYPGNDKNTLNHLNLAVEKGKFYVIVGKNGAGKTTLVRLLCRLYDVDSGIIRYMGEDIRDLECASYRNNIGVVFQDYKYYCMSIAENVAMNEYNDTEETREKIVAALHKAGLKEKIDSLPKGIDTQLGKIFDSEGILLSGGELQKLALAKVLFKDTCCHSR